MHKPITTLWGAGLAISLLLTCCPPCHAQLLARSAPAQTGPPPGPAVTVRQLKEVLKEFKSRYKVDIMYVDQMVEGYTVPANAVKPEGKLEKNLETVLTPFGLRYKKSKDGSYLIVRPRPGQLGGLPGTVLPPHTAAAGLPPAAAKPGVPAGTGAVELAVRGTVTEAGTGGALPGVAILLKGTNQGTTTDAEGRYQIAVPDANAVLVFSYVGYAAQEVTVGERTAVDVQLAADVKSLNEVVVVGYGTQKRSDLTGSVSSVKAEQLTAYPASGVVQALQGRAAGVQVSANNGEPGSAFKVRIRGGTSINASSDPVYVVDGLIGGQLPPPEDIQTVEVLKDASATAIYGSRGANGVIMVTTKRGKAGKTRIEFNASYSSQREINRLDLLDADQYVGYITEVISPTYAPQGARTDWQEEIFRRAGLQNYQLSFAGGTEAVSYYLSGSFFDQQGIVIGSRFNRFSVTSNVDFKATEKLKVGLNLFAQRAGRLGVRTQEGSGGATEAGIISSAFKFMPDMPIYKPDGAYTVAIIGDPIDNPVAIARERKNELVSDRFQGNFFAEYDLVRGLRFRTSFGVSTTNDRTGEFTPTTLNQGRNVGGDAQVDGDKNTLLLNENFLTYSTTFADRHNLTVMGGYSFQKSAQESWGGRGQRFATNGVSYWNLGASSTFQVPNSGLLESTISSYYGRLNYGFADRYLLTFNARYDGSSNFSKNNKWAFFPSGAVAWNMKNEAFLRDVSFLTQLKWRASYGLTGNQAIEPYQTLARFAPVFTIINGVPVNAVRPTVVANNDLTWETTAQLDLGADLGFFNNRLNLTVDYYRMVTSDLLFSVQLPQYSGYPSQLKNIGKVENKGWEVGLATRNLVGAFGWSMDLNVSANRNKVLKLPGGTEIQYASAPGHLVGVGNSQVLREGYPVGSFFGWTYDGVYQEGDAFTPGGGFEQEAGGEKYRDLDGLKDEAGNLLGQPDGQLNADDRAIIGNPHPDFIWGWNNEFTWKGFDLNLFLQGSQGNDILSYTLLELERMSGYFNTTTRALDRWTPENPDTDVPKASAGRPFRVSTRYVYDGSFARLKNVALGYNLPKAVTDKLRLSRLRVYVSAQNVLTLTGYEGYDPEVNYRSTDGTDGNRNLGLDYGSYPNAKSYTVGLNIGF